MRFTYLARTPLKSLICTGAGVIIGVNTRWPNKSPNLGNVPHKQGGIAETVRKCNGEQGIKLATIVVAVTLVAKQWGKAHWNSGMCQYQHWHWALIRLRRLNALCKSCWILCIFCSWGHREACFQSVPSVRRQSAYFDTFTGIFRKCDSANAFWTRYLETAIGWRFRIVQKAPKWVIWRFFKLCRLTSDMDKSVNA